jgi:hypothetical protein|nr:MAG TPA: hypothetical protein [Caudoviricetes sp.]
MLIRSQNKAILLNFSNLTVAYIVKDDEGFIISSIEDENRYRLGGYSSEAKAMKVLDMIQDAYMEYKSGEIVCNGLAGSAYTGSYDTKESVAHGIAVLKGYGNEIRKSILFQMPADSEVVV